MNDIRSSNKYYISKCTNEDKTAHRLYSIKGFKVFKESDAHLYMRYNDG